MPWTESHLPQASGGVRRAGAGAQTHLQDNSNVSFGYMKKEVLRLLSDQDDERALRDLSELFLSATVPIRPGRSFPRNREKYRTRNKPVYLTNSKPAL